MRIDDHVTQRASVRCLVCLLKSHKGVHQWVPALIAADTSISSCQNRGLPDYGTCEKELAHEKSEVVASNDDHLWAQTIVLKTYRVMCHRVRQRQSCVCARFRRRYHSDLLSHSHTVIFAM